MTSTDRPHGFALVTAMGMLALLGGLAVTFVGLSAAERDATEAHRDRVLARMEAEAGIELATASLRALARTRAEDTLADPWVFRGDERDLAGALLPSFAAGGTILVDGRRVGYSGSASGGVGGVPQEGYFTLRVRDGAGRIHLNDGDPARPEAPVNRTLARVLDELATAVGLRGDEGTRLIASRPHAGYAHPSELAVALGADAAARLEPFVTTAAWQDPAALAPVPPAARPARAPWPPPALGCPLWTRAQGLPDEPARTPRAPVNINTASRPVLVALLAGLQGAWLDEAKRPNGTDALGTLAATAPIDRARAGRLADRIVAARELQPLRSIVDLERLCRACVADKVLDARQADVVLANADPNARLNDFNLDAAHRRAVDKTDLLISSTEFCFSSMGVYEIASLGVRLRPGGRSAARVTLRIQERVFEVWRDTTQADFAGEEVSALRDVEAPDGAWLRTIPEPLDADSALRPAAWDGGLTLPPVAEGARVAAARPLLGRTPGVVLPDGVYSERGTPLDLAGAPAGRGSLALWFKPAWNAAASPRNHALVSLAARTPRASLGIDLFYFGSADPWTRAYGLHWEREEAGLFETGLGADHGDSVPAAGTWHHLVLNWDVERRWIEVWIDGTRRDFASTRGQQGEVAGAPAGAPVARDASRAGVTWGDGAGRRLTASAAGLVSVTGADATVAGIDTRPEPLAEEGVLRRLRAGRYGVEPASFRSAPHRLPAGLPGTVSWTLRRPRSLPLAQVSLRLTTAGRYPLGLPVTASGSAPEGAAALAASETLRYELVLAPLVEAPLLETPIIDDVTITWLGPVQVLAWAEEDAAGPR